MHKHMLWTFFKSFIFCIRMLISLGAAAEVIFQLDGTYNCMIHFCRFKVTLSIIRGKLNKVPDIIVTIPSPSPPSLSPSTITKDLDSAVSESCMMEENSSYHQSITGEEAEERLRTFGKHGYLTRYSESNRQYVLSVYKPRGRNQREVMKHFKLVRKSSFLGKKWKIDGHHKNFTLIALLLRHYERNRIDPALRTIGECYTLIAHEGKLVTD